MTHSTFLLLLALGCSDQFLSPVTSPVRTRTDDTGFVPEAADSAETTADSGDTAGGELPDDTAADDSDCHTFEVRWVAPFAGHLLLSGEFQAPDGTDIAGWRDWEEAWDTAVISHVWTGLCADFNWRGSGAVDFDLDGAWDSWTCHNQEDGSDALVGEVSMLLDGAPLPVVTMPSPSGDGGCGVFAEARGL